MKSELERVKLGGEPDYPLQEVLNDLLPKIQVMSEQDLGDWVKGNINFANLKSPMQAIGIVRKELGDKADMAMLTKIVKQICGLPQ